VTFNSLINACAQSGQADRAFQVYKEMQEAGQEANQVTFNSLINACAQSGQVDRAFQVNKEMQEVGQEANQVTFSSLINACARASDEQRSWVAFRDMKASGIVPDNYSLPALLKSQSSDSGIFKALDIVLRIDPSRLNRHVFSAGFSALKRLSRVSRSYSVRLSDMQQQWQDTNRQASPSGAQLCRFFQRGHCKSGDNCKYVHRGSRDPRQTHRATKRTNDQRQEKKEQSSTKEAEHKKETASFTANVFAGLLSDEDDASEHSQTEPEEDHCQENKDDAEEPTQNDKSLTGTSFSKSQRKKQNSQQKGKQNSGNRKGGADEDGLDDLMAHLSTQTPKMPPAKLSGGTEGLSKAQLKRLRKKQADKK